MSEQDEYSRWRARAGLLRHTVSTVVTGAAEATRQHREPGAGLNYLTGPSAGLSMADIGGLLQQVLAVAGTRVAGYEFSVTGGLPSRPPAERRLFASTMALAQAGHLPTAAVQHPRLFSPSRFRASIVHWEMQRVPAVQRVGLFLLDEVWTTSTFVRDSFAGATRRPVRVLPIPVLPPVGEPGKLRRFLGLGGEYLVAYQFDLASSGERKNPIAVLDAWLRAFPAPRDGMRLLLKSVHGSMSLQIWSALQARAADRPDVLLVDAYWPADVISSFFVDIDCYISLHRAEGFGLTLARAMAAGKPVVATGYSGNLDFMTDATSVLVPYRLVRVGRDPVYPADDMWAEPDVDVAADTLRSLVADPEVGRRLGAKAREHVLETRTVAAAADWLHQTVPGLS
jgi:glycosyltransferase involved in cell wall biosynthesis